MAQPPQPPGEGVAQAAGRILTAWRNGENDGLQQELDHARRLAAHAPHSSTHVMETLEALSGAVESLRHGRRQAGAVRLLEHLANTPLPCDRNAHEIIE